MYPKRGLWLGLSIAFHYMEQSSRSEKNSLKKKKKKEKSSDSMSEVEKPQNEPRFSCF